MTSASTMRALRAVRLVLPLSLSAIAVFFEWTEHLTRDDEAITPGFAGEVILFAIVGPVVVALALAWMARLVAANLAASDQLAASNRGLEAAVAERTEHLRTATDQLAATNRELAQANQELRQLDALKSEFVSLVSHQLRAPLTNINGALEIVAQDADGLPPASRRTLQILGSESHRLSHLIQTILEVSRIESGRLVPRPGAVAVEPLLARVCASRLGTIRRASPGATDAAAAPGAADAGAPPDVSDLARAERGSGAAGWSLSVPPGLQPAWADETLVEEVLLNLIENAISHGAGPIEVTAREVGSTVEIAVADHGPGVPASEQGRIFLSFHRANSDESSTRGYGLGLYFADKLIRAQQGSIRLESPAFPGEPEAPGARFVIALPVAGPEPDDDGPAEAGARAGEAETAAQVPRGWAG